MQSCSVHVPAPASACARVCCACSPIPAQHHPWWPPGLGQHAWRPARPRPLLASLGLAGARPYPAERAPARPNSPAPARAARPRPCPARPCPVTCVCAECVCECVWARVRVRSSCPATPCPPMLALVPCPPMPSQARPRARPCPPMLAGARPASPSSARADSAGRPARQRSLGLPWLALARARVHPRSSGLARIRPRSLEPACARPRPPGPARACCLSLVACGLSLVVLVCCRSNQGPAPAARALRRCTPSAE